MQARAQAIGKRTRRAFLKSCGFEEIGHGGSYRGKPATCEVRSSCDAPKIQWVSEVLQRLYVDYRLSKQKLPFIRSINVVVLIQI